jgi:hypothetical protein
MDVNSVMKDDLHSTQRSQNNISPVEPFEIVDDQGNEQSRSLLSEDVEKQNVEEADISQSVTEGAEYLVSTRTKLSFLGFYFLLNLVSGRRDDLLYSSLTFFRG